MFDVTLTCDRTEFIAATEKMFMFETVVTLKLTLMMTQLNFVVFCWDIRYVVNYREDVSDPETTIPLKIVFWLKMHQVVLFVMATLVTTMFVPFEVVVPFSA